MDGWESARYLPVVCEYVRSDLRWTEVRGGGDVLSFAWSTAAGAASSAASSTSALSFQLLESSFSDLNMSKSVFGTLTRSLIAIYLC